MIARGTSDEDHARQHIVRLHGLVARWNEDADTYRRAARGLAPATTWMLEEADRSRSAIHAAMELCDRLIIELPPGHELWSELFRVQNALESLSASIGVSAEDMGPRIEQSHDIAGLKYLVSALRENAGLGAPA